jgi:hypothetical protein
VYQYAVYQYAVYQYAVYQYAVYQYAVYQYAVYQYAVYDSSSSLKRLIWNNITKKKMISCKHRQTYLSGNR